MDDTKTGNQRSEDSETENTSDYQREVQWSDLPLAEQDVEDLKKSGLTAGTVKKLGWYTGTNESNRKLLNWPDEWRGDAEGLVLKYPVTDYAKVKPHRPRLLKPRSEQSRTPREYHDHDLRQRDPDDQDDEEQGKKKKYEAPFERQPQVLNTEVICPDLDDAEIPLAIIEGEKKAALIAQEGFPAIGIPGISMGHDVEARRQSWDDHKDEWVPHPGLAQYLKPNRVVFICGDGPDMDGENMEVVREVVRMAKGIEAVGCKPEIPYVDHDPTHEKTGADDWVYRQMQIMLPHPRKTEALARRFLVGQYFRSARPAAPSELTDWLVNHHEDTGELKEIEIKRALVWCSAWWAGDKKLFTKWVNDLKKKKVCKPESLDRLVQKMPRLGSRYEPRTWVNAWIEKKGYTFSYATEGFVRAGKPASVAEVMAEIEIESTNAQTGISHRNLGNAVRLWEADQRRAALATYRRTLSHDHIVRLPGSGEWLRNRDSEAFLQAVTGRVDPVDVAVVRHFIWLIKRKLFGYPVQHHLMPILVGAQGSGKTTAIKMLLKPLGDLVGFPGDLQFLSDDRQQFRLMRSYVLFFDEMAKADKLASDILKNRITAEQIEYRVLGLNKVQTGPNNATFIGAANKPVKDIIIDPTGMRRFYQLNCLPKMDWGALGRIDFLMLWQSVDENSTSPLAGSLAELQQRQQDLRAKDSVEDFFERRCTLGPDWVKALPLYDFYTDDQKRQSRERQAFTATKFGERMKELVGDDGWKKSNGVWYRVTVAPWSSPGPFEELLDGL